MENLDRCGKCGGEIEFRQKGNVEGFYCKNCEWALVTTHIPQIEIDEENYRVYVIETDFRDEQQIRVISKISGLNYIAVRKLLQQDEPLVFEGNATNVLKVKEILSLSGMRYDISPEFNY